MNDKEKQSSTVFIEGHPTSTGPTSVRVSSPYEKDIMKTFVEDRDTSVTRQQERDHRLQCLKMATVVVGHGDPPKEDPYHVVKFAKRFWRFVQEGK
jgi:hypothetical protein